MKKYAIGADIGGTTVKLGLFTTDGALLEKWEIPTRTENGGKRILPEIAASCRTILAERKIILNEVEGIGFGVPGPVGEDGIIDVCVNLGWENVDLKKEVNRLLGLKSAVGNDANVAAVGECWKGGGKDVDNLVMITLGTGVGCGIIMDGRMVTGAHGYGGEAGHIQINPSEEEACNCGKHGCLEQYCSANGIVRMTKKKLENVNADTILLDYSELTCKDIFSAAKRGDAFALSQVEEFAETLALGLSYISCVIDPELFLIGGGVSKAGTIVTDTVEKHYQNHVFGAQKKTRFALAQLGNDAGIYGAAKLVIE